MTDEKTKVKSGVTVSKEAVFIGDFEFKFQGSLIKQYMEWKDACNGDVTEYEQTVKDLMAKHYAFYGQFQKENKYVKSGSVLWCSGGSKLTAFDILHDHGVVQKDGTPIGICTDCKVNENIYTFEGCKIPAPAGYPERPVVTVKSQPQTTLHKCIPMLNGSWSKSKGSKIKIWDESVGTYVDAITTGDFLTCSYGGIIEVVEVPTVNRTKGSGKVSFQDSTKKLIIQLEGTPFLKPRINDNGTFTIGYGYDFTEAEDPIMFNKYFKKDINGKISVLRNMTSEDAEDTIEKAALKKEITSSLDDLINGQGFGNTVRLLQLNQNQYDALFSYFYANGQSVFTDSKYNEWIGYGGEHAIRAKARMELKNYLINNNGNYDPNKITELFVNSKGANLKYDYKGRREAEASVFNQK